jgi:UDPglucose 6-dehydrogenase
MRDAPALTLVEQLTRLGARVKAYDPLVAQNGVGQGLSNLIVEMDAGHLADGCDALVLVTEWTQFQSLDYAMLAQQMEHPVMIDARNFLDKAKMEQAGFFYVGVGR